MIKMVIFDLDGTLVDSLTDLALNVNRGLRAVGLPEHPVERYRTFVGNGRAMLVRRAMGDAADDSEKFDRVVTTTLRLIPAAARCWTAWRRTAF